MSASVYGRSLSRARFERRLGTHDQSARATAIPASAPPRHSRLLRKDIGEHQSPLALLEK